jgi:hypothetical protein
MYMEALLGISLYKLSLCKSSKNAMSFYYWYVYSSTKLDKRAEKVLPGSEGGGGETEGVGTEGTNGPNNVYTYE